jgi:DICT domain-containing protein
VLVSCFEDSRYFNEVLARRYAQLATAALMIGTFGRGMPAEPAPGVRGTALHAGDPLAQEWVVVVIGAHFGAALVARRPRLGQSVVRAEGPTEEAEDVYYDFAVTYERDLVIAAAQSLVQRIAAPAPNILAGADIDTATSDGAVEEAGLSAPD